MTPDPLLLQPKKARAPPGERCFMRHASHNADATPLHPSKTRQGEATELLAPLKAYVEATIAGHDATAAVDDLGEIAALRSEVVANAFASPELRRDALLRCAPPHCGRERAQRVARAARRALREAAGAPPRAAAGSAVGTQQTLRA